MKDEVTATLEAGSLRAYFHPSAFIVHPSSFLEGSHT